MLELQLEDDRAKRDAARELQKQRVTALRFVLKEKTDEALADLGALVTAVAEHTKKTASAAPTGVVYPKDLEIGTDKHIFAVIGPNMCEGYGDIIIVLSRRIMQHPDFNMTVTAGTSYLSKRAYFHRPWVILGKLVHYVPQCRATYAAAAFDSDGSRDDMDGGGSHISSANEQALPASWTTW